MSIRPWAARKVLSRLTAASLMLAAMAATTLSGTAAADQNHSWFGFPTGGHNPGDTPGLCPGDIEPNALPQGAPHNAPGQVDNLAVLDGCKATINTGGTYYFDQVNIAGTNANLTITEPTTGNKNIIIWASSIIVENGGTLQAGTASDPYGNNGGTLTIYIYGRDLSGGKDPAVAANQGLGALCHGKLDITGQKGPCGIPWKVWSDNGQSPTGLDGSPTVGGVKDYFYQYGPSYGDGRCSDGTTIWDPVGQCDNKTKAANQVGYFGYKVLAVSYGGSLQLFGYKGTTLITPPKRTPRTSFRLPLTGKTEQGGHDVTNSSRNGPSGDTQNGSNFLRFFGFFRQPPGGHNGGGNGSGGGNGLGSGNPLDTDKGPACAQSDPDKHPLSTGCSWLRLAGDLKTTANTLTLSSEVGDKWWRAGDVGDQMVVTTTDYLPGHSELLTIDSVSKDTVTFHTDGATKMPLWFHNGTRYSILDKLGPDDASQKAVKKQMTDAGMDADLIDKGVETRAAVALLTRSIRIISAGDKVGQTFEDAGKVADNCKTYTVTVPNRDNIKQAVPNCYYFGAQTIFRQGFQQIQIQGVEFKYMGQGGKLGHYPIHFHMARQVPDKTFVKDSTINESMTRWIVLHSTQGVLLQRNIGYKSIGHGFMLQDGTEVDNAFYSNLGIFARAAIDNDSNPRKVPGILAAAWAGKNDTGGPINLAVEAFPYRSDYDHPAVYWISNGWNDFQGNMAAGAGACGMSYWLVPAWNSDMPDVPTDDNVFPKKGVQIPGMHMKWSGYAGVQYRDGNAAMTPFKSFYANYATTTMGSFSDVSDMATCQGVVPPTAPPGKVAIPSVLGIPSFAPIPISPASDKDLYYPHLVGGGHQTTRCPLVGGKYDCTQFTGTDTAFPSNSKCNNKGALVTCGVTLLDHYTSSFHWAQTNFAAIWSRPQWFLMTNSFLSDIQNGGVTSFTSGDYSRGAVIEGDWALARTSVFVGNTQTANPFSANSGPFANGIEGALACDGGVASPEGYCLSAAEGISMPLDNFGVSQRLFSIYDGPMYQESNIYLDITKTTCPKCMYAGTPGVRKQAPSLCYLPNAAIAWKQPNGFFYPPSFHSKNLFFGQPRTKDGVTVGGVDIRHYVIDALFKPNTYLQDTDGGAGLNSAYCKPVNASSFTTNFFEGFTDIDRQTELNDDDGSLTGLTNDVKTGTISVNPAEFFNAPLQTAECLSNLGISPTNDKITPRLPCPDANGKLPPTPTPTTATTSPYDYVTTVVYPDCGVGDNSGLGLCGSALAPDKSFNDDGKHFTSIEGRGGTWSKECSNPACYGVPLYRQFLTGDQAGTTRETKTWIDKGCDKIENKTLPACRWPFVRMGGQSTFNRSSLTVNHGTYYLDTSVTLDQQLTENFSNTKPCPTEITKDTPNCAPRSVNVFVKGKYYMFFVFAKTATKQIYQIYVGPGFTVGSKGPSDQTSDLHAVRADLTSRPVNKFTNVDWPTAWTVNYNNTEACGAVPNCGILQITIDMKDQTDLELKPKNGLCLPSTFCKSADGDTGNGPCGGNPEMKKDPSVLANPDLFDEIDRTCKTWAVRDVDFPDAGPLGFSFQMHNDPDGQSLAHRPAPLIFPTTAETGKPDWLTQFMQTATAPDGPEDGGKAGIGDCYYPKLLTNTTPLPANTCSMPKTAEGGIGD